VRVSPTLAKPGLTYLTLVGKGLPRRRESSLLEFGDRWVTPRSSATSGRVQCLGAEGGDRPRFS